MLNSKPICLASSVLELSKTVIYWFWYNYVKPKYDERAKLCRTMKMQDFTLQVMS